MLANISVGTQSQRLIVIGIALVIPALKFQITGWCSSDQAATCNGNGAYTFADLGFDQLLEKFEAPRVSRKHLESALLGSSRSGDRLIVVAEILRTGKLVEGAPYLKEARSLYEEALKQPKHSVLANLRLIDLMLVERRLREAGQKRPLDPELRKAIERGKKIDAQNGFYDLLEGTLGEEHLHQGAKVALGNKFLDAGLSDVLRLEQRHLGDSSRLGPLFLEFLEVHTSLSALNFVQDAYHRCYYEKVRRNREGVSKRDPDTLRSLLPHFSEGREIADRLYKSFDLRVGRFIMRSWQQWFIGLMRRWYAALGDEVKERHLGELYQRLDREHEALILRATTFAEQLVIVEALYDDSNSEEALRARTKAVKGFYRFYFGPTEE